MHRLEIRCQGAALSRALGARTMWISILATLSITFTALYYTNIIFYQLVVVQRAAECVLESPEPLHKYNLGLYFDI